MAAIGTSLTNTLNWGWKLPLSDTASLLSGIFLGGGGAVNLFAIGSSASVERNLVYFF